MTEDELAEALLVEEQLLDAACPIRCGSVVRVNYGGTVVTTTVSQVRVLTLSGDTRYYLASLGIWFQRSDLEVVILNP